MEKDTTSPEDMQDRLDLIEHKLKFAQQKPLVAIVTDFNPVKTVPTILSTAIEKAGGVAIDDELVLTAEILIVYKTDSGIGETMTGLSIAVHQAGLQDMPAIKNNRIYIIDTLKAAEKGKVELIESLAEIIHPKQFVFGFEGDLWVQFDV